MHSSLVFTRDFAYVSSAPSRRTAQLSSVEIYSGHETFAELLSGPMIEFHVGEGRKQWSVHRKLLQPHSSLELDDIVELSDHDPAGFALLVEWLYHGQLPSLRRSSDEEKYRDAVTCYHLYRICDALKIYSLGAEAIALYQRGLHESQLVPDADELTEIYCASSAGSPLRRLMVKIAARQIMDPEIERDVESYRQCISRHPDFAIQVLREIRCLSGGILFEDPTCAGYSYQRADRSPNQALMQAHSQVNISKPSADVDRTVPDETRNHCAVTHNRDNPDQGCDLHVDGPDDTAMQSHRDTSHSATVRPTKRFTPCGTPSAVKRPVEVSGLVKKYDDLGSDSRTLANRMPPRKLRQSGHFAS